MKLIFEVLLDEARLTKAEIFELQERIRYDIGVSIETSYCYKDEKAVDFEISSREEIGRPAYEEIGEAVDNGDFVEVMFKEYTMWFPGEKVYRMVSD